MSRRDLRILLDTSFLLPFLGFKTEDIIMNSIPLLKGFDVYYSDVSILEALWKIAKMVRGKEELKIVSEGANAVRRAFRHVGIDESAITIALEMYILGHRDMVDNMLYGISVSQGIRLLTVDESLEKFIEEHGLRDTLIHPRELGRV